ncbi:MAG: transposase [Phycisphaerales bacterium]|nr:transposase [Phycisphaerales bacterium]
MQEVVERHCALRGWKLWAVNARSNHVHVVVDCGEVAPEDAMSQFKAWSTRELRSAGYVEAAARVWTEHGSTRYLWQQESIAFAVRYVLERQEGSRG